MVKSSDYGSTSPAPNDFAHYRAKSEISSEHSDEHNLSLHVANNKMMTFTPCNFFQQIVRKLFPTGFKSELKILILIALPVIITNLSLFLILSESIMLCGHLSKAELDGVSLANSIINALGISIATGAATACDTLFSQTFGSSNKKQMGIYLQQSFGVLWLIPFVLWPLHINMESIFIYLGQEPEISSIAAEFMIYYSPGIFFNFTFLILARYMQNQDYVYPPMFIGIAGNLFNVIFQYVAIYQLHYRYQASAVIQAASYVLMVILEIIYICGSKMYIPTWPGWQKKSLYKWGQFTKLVVPGVLMVSMETFCWEIGTFIAGSKGENELGTQSVLFQIETWYFQVALGIAIAVNIRVGQNLGGGYPLNARTAYHVGLLCIITISCISSTLFIILRNYLPFIFTDDSEIVAMSSQVLPILAGFQFIDGIGVISAGALRGCGRQIIGTVLVFSGYYIFGLPTGIPLFFLTDLGVLGLWLGLLIGLIITVPGYVIVLTLQDWSHQSKLASLRAASSNQKKESQNDETMALVKDNGVDEANVFEKQHRRMRTPSNPAYTTSQQMDIKLSLSTSNYIENTSIGRIVLYRVLIYLGAFSLLMTGILVKVIIPRDSYFPPSNATVNSTLDFNYY